MEEDILIAPPGYKLYKDVAIRLATFFGGPLAAGYLAAENFKQLGQHELVGKTWIISIAASVVIFGGIFLLPDTQRIPPYVIPFAYSWIAYGIVHKYQGEAIKVHNEKGGFFYSNWRVVLVSLVGLVITVAILFAIILLTEKGVMGYGGRNEAG